MVARQELEAQGEGSEALDLLGEADGSEGGVGRVALPALDGAPRLCATLEAGLRHQVERQHLRSGRGFSVLGGGSGGGGGGGGVVGTVDVQVVV